MHESSPVAVTSFLLFHLFDFNRKSDFDVIWCAEANSSNDVSRFIKIRNFANSKWRTSAILKICFGHDSAPNYPILVNFCVMMKIRYYSYMTKTIIFENCRS